MIKFLYNLSSSLLLLGLCLQLPLGNAADKPKKELYAADPKSLELNEKGVSAAKIKDGKLAEELFRQSLAADQNNLTAAYNLAGMYLTNQKEGLATTLLEEYTKKFPDDAGLQARLGDAYFATKLPQKAAQAYERALTLEPNYEGVPAKLATVYLLSNKPKEAEAMLLKAVELEPKNAKYLLNLSNVFLLNGKNDQAISTARRALHVKPSSEIYVTLGSAYESMNDKKNALISYQRAIDLGDSRPELLNKVEGLKKANS